jgi:molybdate transport system substrate-binding protein
MMRFFKTLISIAALAVWTGGGTSHARAEQPLVIFAASSLRNVVTELSHVFAKQQNHETVVSFAASSVLARQIKDGAPANVFISADTAWMDDVINAGVIVPKSRTIIAGNRLALAGAPGISFPPIPNGLLSADYPLATVAPHLPFSIGNPDYVPVGIYAHQALQNLGLWQGVMARIVTMPSARSVMANIDRGEVAGGIVYASDLRFSKNVHLVGLFPSPTHSQIQYIAGIVGERRTPTADAFLVFLVSPEAENVFKEFGFLPPSPL